MLISHEAKLVLKIVSTKAGTGYALMSRTGLQSQQLVTAVTELREHKLVEVKGGTPNDLFEAYIYVPPPAKHQLQFIV